MIGPIGYQLMMLLMDMFFSKETSYIMYLDGENQFKSVYCR